MPHRRITWVSLFVILGVAGCADQSLPPDPRTRINYQTDIYPILAANCLGCHGASRQEGGLRLDTFAGATASRTLDRAIEPGQPDRSLVMQRITSSEPSRMPPAPAASLDAAEIALLERWIIEGAQYGAGQGHWSFVPPTRPELPAGDNAVDAFISARLASLDIAPSPQASPEVLLRRVTLDLTGLPPTAAEREDFLRDPSDAAYEAVVERLLASPAHAEHLARDWLDYSGYGDTNGVYVDDERLMWPWRDWVIDSFRQNRPLDAFVRLQLAGDLEPDATDDDVLATAYLRMHPTTSEGGTDPEEWRSLHALHRAQTVSTQLLGITAQCAQCHDHKYDPISQVDFFSLVDCFNRTADRGFVGSPEAETPTLEAHSPLARERVASLDARVADLERALVPLVDGEVAGWEARVRAEPSFASQAISTVRSERGTAYATSGDQVVASGPNPNVESFHATLVSTSATRTLRFTMGASRGPVTDLSQVTVELDEALGRRRIPIAFARDAAGSLLPQLTSGTTVSRTEIPSDAFVDVVLGERLPVGAQLRMRLDFRRGFACTPSSIRIASSPDESSVLTPAQRAALALPEGSREPSLQAAILDAFARTTENDLIRTRIAERDRLIQERAFISSAVRTRVMREDDPERETHVWVRGTYGMNGERVRCAAPRALTPRPLSFTNRRGLAEWIVSASSPTTTRVLVDHYIQFVFGRGLLATPGDWGIRGGLPSHPEMLDWLAVELRESGWDLRAMLRMFVLSRTYRQSSAERPEMAAIDPQNRLLHRAHRVRLSAEALRDQALLASGLLQTSLGGPPSFPYHPDGVYEIVNDSYGELTTYRPDRATERMHRRALYTFWRRSNLHPFMSLLDAPGRVYASARREETSTPTQALALWNEPLMVEAARELAELAQREHPFDVDAQIAFVLSRALSREATEEELSLLRGAYDDEAAELTDDDARALLNIGESDWQAAAPIELAALTSVVRAVFNTSESQTRE